MSGQLLAFYNFQTISLITGFAIVWIYFYPLKKLSLENPEEIQNCTIFQSLPATGKMWPILANKRDGDLRPHPSDPAGHSGAGDILCQDIFTF